MIEASDTNMNEKINERIYHEFGPDEDTAKEFFAVFSRFECALKSANCFDKNPDKHLEDINCQRIKPNWSKYCARYLEKNENLKAKVITSSKYLLENPPQMQCIQNKTQKIKWNKPKKHKETDLEWIFYLLKLVRNNLFHGGKYEIGQDGSYNSSRDEDLLQTCLKVLYVCLDDDNPVTKAFFVQLR